MISIDEALIWPVIELRGGRWAAIGFADRQHAAKGSLHVLDENPLGETTVDGAVVGGDLINVLLAAPMPCALKMHRIVALPAQQHHLLQPDDLVAGEGVNLVTVDVSRGLRDASTDLADRTVLS